MPSVLPPEYLGLPSTFMYAASRERLVVMPHIEAIERAVIAALQAGDQLLTVEAPVRHGKSWYLDHYLPAWFLAMHPTLNVGLASYEHRFAASWGQRARDTLEEFGASYGVRVDPNVRSRDWWQIEKHGGSMRSMGVGGPITGKGFDLLIIDDPVKNRAEAESEVYRTAAWEWLESTALTRLEPGGVCVLAMARWHEDDLVGRVHAEMGAEWTRLSIPAIAEEGDPLGRPVGAALWPQRYPIARLERIQRRVGAYWFNALYQQRPSPPTGRIFQRADWQTYYAPQPLETFDRLVWSWDMAFKGNADSDYVVAQAWGRRGADFYLLHQQRERLDYPATKALVQGNYRDAQWAPIRRVLIEDKANGSAIIADLRHEVPGLIGVPTPDGKLARAHRVSPYVASHNVHLPSPELAPWIAGFIDEAAAFPAGANDDQVDAFTQAVSDLASYNESSVSVPTGALPSRRRG